MKRDLFKSLPSEIITHILSRLSVRAIARSKCVCKPWLHLLQMDEFVKSYFSTSAAALAALVPEENSSRCAVFELGDAIDAESSHHHRYWHLNNYDFPDRRVSIEGSANGLLFLIKAGFSYEYDIPYVWNPVCHEYIELPRPEEFVDPELLLKVIYGFGVCKRSGQNMVVRIIPQSECHHIYTLGTGSWRCGEAAPISFDFGCCLSGAFVNGNLHWLMSDSNSTPWSLCFDLETECFSTFSVPPLQGNLKECKEGFSSLKDCLCVCDHTSENEIVLWLMKEYGDDKSWMREYVINLSPDFGNYAHIYPIVVFKDGDVLMLWDGKFPFYYSNKTGTAQKTSVFPEREYFFISARLLTRSFVSLKSLAMENVISL